MFEPAEFLTLEHTAHPKLFENQKYVWDALKQIASYLQFRLKPGVLGELVGKPFISRNVLVGTGTIFEQGAVLKGPAWIGENCHIRSGCYVRENVIVGDGVVMGNSCAIGCIARTCWSMDKRCRNRSGIFIPFLTFLRKDTADAKFVTP